MRVTSILVRSVLMCTDGSDHAERAVSALPLSMLWLGQIEALRVIGTYHIGTYDDSAEIRAAVDAAVGLLAAQRH